MAPLPDLGRPPDIPQQAIADAQALLASGRLHRYAEAGGDGGTVAALEREFAALIGCRYAVAVNSCGSALFLALKAADLRPGDPVLMNAFTLTPVPGAIDHIGAQPVLVEITEDLTIDFDDLRAKARSSGARVLMLSHMRGHLCDLDVLSQICAEDGLTLIEDCAHTLGASWAGRSAGSFGRVGCFSFQSGKHVNTGEGGVLVTDDPDIAARAILHSGSYMLYGQHGTVPPDAVMARWRGRCGNYSLRMSALVATLARPQLPLLPARVADWNASHDRIAARLGECPHFRLPHRPEPEAYAQSSLQFQLAEFDPPRIAAFVARARDRGLWVKWFGTETAEGYNSNPAQWPGAHVSEVPRAFALQQRLCDIRLPLRLSAAQCDDIAETLIAATDSVAQGQGGHARA